MNLLARLFRRTPPHLRRVPHEGGLGMECAVPLVEDKGRITTALRPVSLGDRLEADAKARHEAEAAAMTKRIRAHVARLVAQRTTAQYPTVFEYEAEQQRHRTIRLALAQTNAHRAEAEWDVAGLRYVIRCYSDSGVLVDTRTLTHAQVLKRLWP